MLSTVVHVTTEKLLDEVQLTCFIPGEFRLYSMLLIVYVFVYATQITGFVSEPVSKYIRLFCNIIFCINILFNFQTKKYLISNLYKTLSLVLLLSYTIGCGSISGLFSP